MFDTRTALDSDKPLAFDKSIAQQHADATNLTALLEINAAEHARRQLFRHPHDEEQMLLMRHPLTMREAYGTLGALLGVLPPAAIFHKIFGYVFDGHNNGDPSLMIVMCLAMNIVCGLVGWRMGRRMGVWLDNMERLSWHRTILNAIIAGLCWGVVTGGAGGLVYFGLGAIFGFICAVPVGVYAFVLFTTLHRTLARDGMIDARHFWPLACGITLTISALILGM
jgi:hypothetical protein